jgi:hypothetical protein
MSFQFLVFSFQWGRTEMGAKDRSLAAAATSDGQLTTDNKHLPPCPPCLFGHSGNSSGWRSRLLGYRPQYSSGRRKVVAVRSRSVMIQKRT